jgi:hypothetical protein
MNLAAALLAAAAIAPDAAAALEVRLAVTPAAPRAGRTATITLRTYTPVLRPDGTCCLLEPTSVEYPFRVEAESPRGRLYRI